ncbi:16S rRNA (cytosine(1402)-N(4))-methyltransferase RsmH [Methylohalobius crimeensis]|uniref:16S rRNA (cytosine(1402)-N(4))-methyltransferase RsmH n=1 Tax=Methylohalobius crimeensis TaxID=244365 RepID=UPI00126911D1|nr:16S rRNA (cytosine(1402)-N(4))-methyltransferase RsmH [Methylohalobius crimeensis]
MIHQPVMLEEALAGLAVRNDGVYVDGTFGRGGHSRAILEQLGREGRLIALDKDPDAVASTQARQLAEDRRFSLIHADFNQLREVIEEMGYAGRIDGILLDLGVSSPQLDTPERGFAFLHDGPLDMRMNPDVGMSAADWLAQAPMREIADVIRKFGEERFAHRIARAIVEARSRQPLLRTRQLTALIERAVPARERHKHPATRTFQALRIHINRELESLEAVLEQAVDLLVPGGRLVVIAFHSLEDRIVKRFLRAQSRGTPLPKGLPVTGTPSPQRLKVLGKKRPDALEASRNPRARSAILRIAERRSC